MKTYLKKSSLYLFLCFIIFGFTNSSISSWAVKLDEMGGAYLIFAEKFGGKVYNKDLKIHKTIGVSGCATGSKIIQFNMRISQNNKVHIFSGKSGVLSTDILKVLSNLSKGDSFSFDHVKARLPDQKSIVDVSTKTFYVA
jgi:hypothetical protein